MTLNMSARMNGLLHVGEGSCVANVEIIEVDLTRAMQASDMRQVSEVTCRKIAHAMSS
jgi:isopentenyl diphosphate isomerase/L-lactate dehydrogenase-like FMN-dependent dehydrogenase